MAERHGFPGLQCPECGSDDVALCLAAEPDLRLFCDDCDWCPDDADLPQLAASSPAWRAALAWARTMPFVRSEGDHAAP